jgi:GT2 family glycosyltransferase
MRWYGEYGALSGYALIQSEGPISPSFLTTANLSVKTEFAKRVGGFNSALTVHEDYDFGYRMAAIGLRMYFRRAALGYHYQTFTFEQACLRCKRLSSNLAPFLKTEAGRKLFRKESGLGRRMAESIARVPAAMLSPLLRFIDSDVVLPNAAYRLLYWEHANRRYRADIDGREAGTFDAPGYNSSMR